MRLKELGAHGVSELSGIVENVTFPCPSGLAGNAVAKAPEVGPPPLKARRQPRLRSGAEPQEQRHERRHRDGGRQPRRRCASSRLAHRACQALRRNRRAAAASATAAACVRRERRRETGLRAEQPSAPARCHPPAWAPARSPIAASRSPSAASPTIVQRAARQGHRRPAEGSSDRDEFVQLESRTLFDELCQHREAGVLAALQRDRLLERRTRPSGPEFAAAPRSALVPFPPGARRPASPSSRCASSIAAAAASGASDSNSQPNSRPLPVKRVAEPADHGHLQAAAALDAQRNEFTDSQRRRAPDRSGATRSPRACG